MLAAGVSVTILVTYPPTAAPAVSQLAAALSSPAGLQAAGLSSLTGVTVTRPASVGGAPAVVGGGGGGGGGGGNTAAIIGGAVGGVLGGGLVALVYFILYRRSKGANTKRASDAGNDWHDKVEYSMSVPTDKPADITSVCI